MLLLEQNITKKKQIDKNKIKFHNSNDSGIYKIKAICNSAIYIKK